MYPRYIYIFPASGIATNRCSTSANKSKRIDILYLFFVFEYAYVDFLPIARRRNWRRYNLISITRPHNVPTELLTALVHYSV